MPVLGAAIVAAGGWDHDISDWAVRERPVFGSDESARDASDLLCTSAHVGMIATIIAVPSKSDSWLASVAKRTVWEHVGVLAATGLVDPIRRTAGRDRPLGGKRSFPSWHATRAAAYVALGNRNISLASVSSPFRYSTQSALALISTGTGWAEIEAGEHYPTDVLVGAALGSFVALLVHDVFLSSRVSQNITVRIDMNEGMSLAFDVRF
jgi:hypothetical protein